MPVTIRDVAKLAGCSIKTVSRVINDEPYVTDETRARVNAAIRAIGYAPNISAKRLAQNKAYMICLLMYPGFYQQGSELLSQIMDIGYEENYDILIQPYFSLHSRSRRKLVNLIYEQRIDGFVVTPPLDADDFVADMISTYKVPQVLISPLVRGKTPFVAGDDFRGGYSMTEALLEMGHRRIGFLAGPGNMRAAEDRKQGYLKAVADSGLPLAPDLVCASEWTFLGGYTMARMLLDAENPPTAIFASNDEAAYGVVFAAQEMGRKIPDDLSVCGYDDLPLSSKIWPGLSTVHQPSDELIQLAARLMINLLKGNSQEKTMITVPFELILRGSTAPPRITGR